MPIYLLRCKVCTTEFEVLQSYNAPLPFCPRCCAVPENVVRIIAPCSIAFKGEGFYSNDAHQKPPAERAPGTKMVTSVTREVRGKE